MLSYRTKYNAAKRRHKKISLRGGRREKPFKNKCSRKLNRGILLSVSEKNHKTYLFNNSLATSGLFVIIPSIPKLIALDIFSSVSNV
jgi:hypothetical protein